MPLDMDSNMRDEKKSEILGINYQYSQSSGHFLEIRSFSVHVDDACLFYTKIQLSNRYKVQTTGTIPQVGVLIYPLSIMI